MYLCIVCRFQHPAIDGQIELQKYSVKINNVFFFCYLALIVINVKTIKQTRIYSIRGSGVRYRSLFGTKPLTPPSKYYQYESFLDEKTRKCYCYTNIRLVIVFLTNLLAWIKIHTKNK